MSLLTDKELDNGMQAGVADWVISLRPTGDLNRSMFQGVIEAQQTKTLKAVAEWGNVTCWNGLHSEENIIAVRQMECPDCRDELLEAAAKGKMPGGG